MIVVSWVEDRRLDDWRLAPTTFVNLYRSVLLSFNFETGQTFGALLFGSIHAPFAGSCTVIYRLWNLSAFNLYSNGYGVPAIFEALISGEIEGNYQSYRRLGTWWTAGWESNAESLHRFGIFSLGFTVIRILIPIHFPGKQTLRMATDTVVETSVIVSSNAFEWRPQLWD